MTRRSLLITWLLITALCSLFAYLFCCNSSGASAMDKHAAHQNSQFTVAGDSGFSATCGYGQFKRSSFELIKSIDPDCMQQLADYLQSNPNQLATIEGFYAESEENNSIYQNLGLARAAHIKSILVNQYGVNENQIATTSSLVGEEALVNDELLNGYSLQLEKLKVEEQAEPEDSYSGEEIVLHFNSGSQEPNMDEQIRKQFASLLAYLEQHPNNNLMVTGHTDTKGSSELNQELGQQRANQVKQYLIKNGITAERIETKSMGESMPVSTIDAENRRVTVTINQ